MVYRTLGWPARKHALQDRELGLLLLRAARTERPESFLASLWAMGLIAAAGGLALSAFMVWATPASVPWFVTAPLLIVIPAFSFMLTLVVGRFVVSLKVQERALDLDVNLLHGLNYMLALSAAGLEPKRMFKSLAGQRVYGVLAEEAGFIYRDLAILGFDLINALKNAIERAPSEKFREFLQGALSAFQSGVDLQDYLKAKVAHYQRQQVEDQRKFLDTLGIIAESFLVIVVAAPLFLITLLAVMSVNQGDSVLFWGYGIGLIYLPLCQIGVIIAVSGMTSKVTG
ncbi:MAG TPA: type II secretion system F family protein [Candidatus Thermoplasmatota archaeon]|nr:type II secretion system F family protein [Candidatus Thermoplasmatota archaeon]